MPVLSSTGNLCLERRNFLLGARRHDGDLACPIIADEHLHGLALAFEDRDIARLGATRGQVEQSPCIGRRIVFGDLVRVPKIGPDIVPGVDRDLVGLVGLRIRQWNYGRELPKNGDVPKSPLLPIGSSGAIGGRNSNLKIDLGL